MLRTDDLVGLPDFTLGGLAVSPSRRIVARDDTANAVEPRVMQVLVLLSRDVGKVVTRRRLFDEVWGGAPVGDDSLNRAIAGARKAISLDPGLKLETIPGTGYMLTITPGFEVTQSANRGHGEEKQLQSAVEEAYDCWRTGLPKPDVEAIESLRSALEDRAGDARAWGVHALLLRKAAEYAEHDECAEYVRSCEQAARRALSLEPGQSDAQVALAGMIPIFGNWSKAREQLAAVREKDPAHVPAAHDMAVLEMATGRPSSAKPILEELIARDPLAPTFYYKRLYHLWTFGEVAEMDQIAARALQLWPRHPAIWIARLWTLVFTGRAAEALRLLDDRNWAPPLPQAAIALLHGTCSLVAAKQAGEVLRSEAVADAVQAAVAAASRGPAQAVAGLLSLCALDAIDEAFEVAYGYYLGRGSAASPIRWNAEDASVTDQHRRVTQLLFIPAAEGMRNDPRFLRLCSDIGLSAYWANWGITPDFCAGISKDRMMSG